MKIDTQDVKEVLWEFIESGEIAMVVGDDGTTYIEAGRIRVLCEHCGEIHGMPSTENGKEDKE